VDILLNGKHFLSIPERKMGTAGSGKLVFYTNAKGAGPGISATVWTCYDHNMHRVFCNAPAIP
jgi:hypothetical protein